MAKHIDIKVHGDVQGVFFRAGAKQKADELGIFGSAKNNGDGTVSIEVEGEDNLVDAFLVWVRYGPPGANVDRVDTNFGSMQNYKDFSIKY